ncbi:hypothetical protein KUCAC02_032118 [Chaenocephalus aceratus]|nr:hypothetical protein KUCAC02_032118 [Chaenocephalus aceratus]
MVFLFGSPVCFEEVYQSLFHICPSRSDPENDLGERFLCDGQPGAEPRENLIPVSARQQVRLSRAFAELHIRPSDLSAERCPPPSPAASPPASLTSDPEATGARAAAERPAPAGPPKKVSSELQADLQMPRPLYTAPPSPRSQSRIPRPSMSQGCSRETSRDTSPARGFSPWVTTRRHSRSTSALSSAEGYSGDEASGAHDSVRQIEILILR